MNPAAANTEGYHLITGCKAVVRDDGKPDSCKSLGLRLPYPPTVNTYWRRVGHKTLVSRRGREYWANVAAVVFEAPPRRFTRPVSVELRVTKPDNRQRDLDNLPKAVLDALEYAAVLENDSLVKRLLIEEVGVKKPGWLDVKIETL
jgi:Holliday junction resolvase RusA-like endonuclease